MVSELVRQSETPLPSASEIEATTKLQSQAAEALAEPKTQSGPHRAASDDSVPPANTTASNEGSSAVVPEKAEQPIQNIPGEGHLEIATASQYPLPESLSPQANSPGSDSQSRELTPEIRKVIESAEGLVVRMPSKEGTKNADLVIKTDGSVEQYLDMDPARPDNQKLTIALEQDVNSNSTPTAEQAQALQKLLAFASEQGKPVEMSPSPPAIENKGHESSPEARPNNYEPRDLDPDKTAATQKQQTPAPDTYTSRYGRPGSPSRQSSEYESSPPGRYIDQSNRGSTAYDTGYRPSVQRDWNQVDVAELLAEWFNADPETFKKLMPDLYKRLVGADGKLDLKKLKAMQDSKDPALEGLRKQLPLFAEVFPASSSGTGFNTSDGAVNDAGALLAAAAPGVADRLPGTGYCAKGVSYAISDALGIVIGGNANDMRDSLPQHGFQVADSKNLKVGQVIHVYWTPEVYAQEQARRGPCPNYGDIAVIGKGPDGKLYAYNDAATPLDQYLSKSRYDWSTLKAFNPPSNTS